MLIVYRVISLLLHPFVVLYLMQRKQRGKEHATRMGERFGKTTLPRPDGAVIWLHGASVGEAQSLLPLIHALHADYPQATILLTTGTVTSAAMVENKLPARTIHQFIPVDTWLSVRRFLNHWKPDFAIWSESELWPNLICMTGNTRIPMALLNARMSQKSFQRWQSLKRDAQTMISQFALVCPQSDEDAAHFAAFGAHNQKMLGNLKHDAPPLPADAKDVAALAAQVAGRPIWVAASTHPGEEILIAQTHQELSRDFPNLLTIIIPRHANRGPELASELVGYNVARRSRGETATSTTAIYIADTMGELGIFYRLARIVFMGGSLVPHGGQNPLEPARLDCAIITGPHTQNFTAICDEMQLNGALLRIQDRKELAPLVSDLLRDPAKQERYAKAALTLANDKQGVLLQVLGTLAPLLASVITASGAPKKKGGA